MVRIDEMNLEVSCNSSCQSLAYEELEQLLIEEKAAEAQHHGILVEEQRKADVPAQRDGISPLCTAATRELGQDEGGRRRSRRMTRHEYESVINNPFFTVHGKQPSDRKGAGLPKQVGRQPQAFCGLKGRDYFHVLKSTITFPSLALSSIPELAAKLEHCMLSFTNHKFPPSKNSLTTTAIKQLKMLQIRNRPDFKKVLHPLGHQKDDLETEASTACGLSKERDLSRAVQTIFKHINRGQGKKLTHLPVLNIQGTLRGFQSIVM